MEVAPPEAQVLECPELFFVDCSGSHPQRLGRSCHGLPAFGMSNCWLRSSCVVVYLAASSFSPEMVLVAVAEYCAFIMLAFFC